MIKRCFGRSQQPTTYRYLVSWKGISIMRFWDHRSFLMSHRYTLTERVLVRESLTQDSQFRLYEFSVWILYLIASGHSRNEYSLSDTVEAKRLTAWECNTTSSRGRGWTSRLVDRIYEWLWNTWYSCTLVQVYRNNIMVGLAPASSSVPTPTVRYWLCVTCVHHQLSMRVGNPIITQSSIFLAFDEKRVTAHFMPLKQVSVTQCCVFISSSAFRLKLTMRITFLLCYLYSVVVTYV